MPTTLNAPEILAHALKFAQPYNGNLTLRQLYYRFVSTGLHPEFKKPGDGQRFYKKIGLVMNKSRLSGDFPLDWLMDRTREAKLGEFRTDDTEADDCLGTCAYWMRNMPNDAVKRDHWIGQSTYFTIGVEKEALAGVFEEPCEALGAGLFVFRGYVSVSAIYQWCQNLRAAFDSVPDGCQPIDQAVMCYFGDHDPDGLEIPAAFLRTVEKILKVKEWDDLPPVTVRRIALTREQILKFSPPPFEAKKTSSRYKRYVARTGLTDAWELDALEPNELQRLIRACAKPYFDWAVHEENRDLIERVRDEVWTSIGDSDWSSDLIGQGRHPSRDTSFWPTYVKDRAEEGQVVDPHEFDDVEDDEDEE